MKTQKQLSMFKKTPRFFGGRLLLGRRKSRRPLASRESFHLVMRSSWAMGPNSFLRKHNQHVIQRLIKTLSHRYGIKIYRWAIVGNHIHLVMLMPHRRNYNAFIRVLSSKIATHVMRGQSFKMFMESLRKSRWSQGAGDGGQRSSRASGLGITTKGDQNLYSKRDITAEVQGKGQKFWQFRPFTRLLYWGKDFRGCCRYVVQNTLEALGFIAYTSRSDVYSKWFRDH